MKVLDIFCGAGGLADGFKRAGFKVDGVDISEHAGRTYLLNKVGSFLKADLSCEIIDGDYEIIIGGPPCKPWSSVNIRKRGKMHPDYHLLARYFEHIKYHSPKFFLLENVPPLANDHIYKANIKQLKSICYSVIGKKIIYSDFGAPIRRHRFIVFGARNGDAGLFFEKLSEQKKAAKIVKDVIWHLRDKKKDETNDHVWPELKTIGKYKEYYKTGKYGWYVLDWDQPAPSFGNIMKTYILHPDSFNGRTPRVISVKEAALIMGFDEDFCFPEGLGLGSRYQMIVDAVSPAFSCIAANVIKEIIDEESFS
jgi:DNA (cytosine-5)-methyltransferase 1